MGGVVHELAYAEACEIIRRWPGVRERFICIAISWKKDPPDAEGAPGGGGAGAYRGSPRAGRDGAALSQRARR